MRLLDQRAGAWLPLLGHEGAQQGQVRHPLHRGGQSGGVGGPDHPLQGLQVVNHVHCTVLFLLVLIREMYQLLSSRYPLARYPPTLPQPLSTSLPLSPPLAGIAHYMLQAAHFPNPPTHCPKPALYAHPRPGLRAQHDGAAGGKSGHTDENGVPGTILYLMLKTKNLQT